MAKIVWPPIKDGKCCEVDCADINDADPCKCECCEGIEGVQICTFKWDYGSATNAGDCITQFYKYATDVTHGIGTPSGCFFTEDGEEDGAVVLEYKNTPEQIELIAEAENTAAQAHIDMETARDASNQKPESGRLRDLADQAEVDHDEALANLEAVREENKPMWLGAGIPEEKGCSSYEGDRYDEDGRLIGGVVAWNAGMNTNAGSSPPVDTEWIPMEGIVLTVGEDPEFEGIPWDRSTGNCDCPSPSGGGCPDREPRYDIDLNEDGVIDSDETDLCWSDEDGNGTYEYYECDPQDDCYGCTDSASSNYDANATIDDGSCCTEDCTEGPPGVFLPDSPFAHVCCCPENAVPPSEEGTVAENLGSDPGGACCDPASKSQGLGDC